MYLDKPDPNKPAFKLFPTARANTIYGRCPCCKKIVNKTGGPHDKVPGMQKELISSPFRDDLSRKEYSISGMCQDCQDEVFGA